ncbi:hypothetical protein C5B42_01275 [Candidatus Cerribacteria bacterium 'Amazon FNV 2010 28 9']|uniref:GIY-YIG domain-containing protein n=1 Tax=Candidatus Cerribacteria bacterium 'Amazon FNV 2010 28 9' TaxID=2081795 RepID=A0A317JQ33_9BACT|nr:MAG: hypothetical protein C5B42_01275 [Candidatus Cerribacteria bacterium 'Amazon FNV 2010 28 9']
MFFVYILRTCANTLYIGQTNNLEKRLKEHRSKSLRSSKYVRSFSSFVHVYTETFKTRSEALKREWELKQWPRKKKDALIADESKIMKET